MSANNRKKNSKELTLQEIIQKSTLRKNIQSLSINEPHHHTVVNGNFLFNNVKSATSTKVNHVTNNQFFNSKQQSNNNYSKQQANLNKNSTARTINPFKQTHVYNIQAFPEHFKNPLKNSQKSKQFKSSTQLPFSVQKRKDSSKNKSKKHSDYLCIKGSSGNVLNHKLQNEPQNQFFHNNGMKNYHTLAEFSSQITKKQKSTEFSTINIQKNQQTKKHHSFMLTKYTTSNNFRQKLSKSIENKKSHHKNMFNNLILPEQFVNKKIQYRGIKTQQKTRVKINFDNQSNKQNKRKTNKFQILKAISSQESPIKQVCILNNTIFKSEDVFKNIQQSDGKKDKKESPLKKESESCSKQEKLKGFRGTKIKSISTSEKVKQTFFIPDFLKPSLDLVMFDKKIIEVIKTQQNENENVESLKNDQKKQETTNQCDQFEYPEDSSNNNKLSQLLLCMKAAVTQQQQSNKNITISPSQQQHINQQLTQQQVKINEIIQDQYIKNIKNRNQKQNQKRRKRKRNDDFNNDLQQQQICGWQDNDNKPSNTKQKQKGQKIIKFTTNNMGGQLFDY